MYSETSVNAGCDHDCISVIGMVTPVVCVQPSPTEGDSEGCASTDGPKAYVFNRARGSGSTCLMLQTEAAKPETQWYSRSHPQRESGVSQEITPL